MVTQETRTEIRHRTADLSPDGAYRYELTRTWADDPDVCPAVCWIMLNPSTADDAIDDHTVRKCVTFSDRWGFGSLIVVNLFAFRATDPADLRRVDDPVGHLNDAAILAAAIAADRVVCAWGNHGVYRDRAAYVTNLLAWTARLPLFSVGQVSKQGQPKHPGRLPLSLTPVAFR